MKRLVSLLAVVVLLVAAAPISDMAPSQFRTVTINGSTAVAFTMTNTIASSTAGAATGDPNTFTLATTAVANNLGGLIVKFAGSCSSAGDVRMIKSNTTTVATMFSGTTGQVDGTCTYTIGPAFLKECRVLIVGGCSSTCYISTVSGGTATTNKLTLAGSQLVALDMSGVKYLEVLGSGADTVNVGCLQ